MRRLGAALAVTLLFVPLARATQQTPHQLYDAFVALRVDPAEVYKIGNADRIELRRADVLLSFDKGTLAFFQPLDGRITGAVFSGRAHAVATPRGAVEKQQLARFLGAPLLDQDFSFACLRFSDDTADDLLRQLRNRHLAPEQDSAYADQVNPLATANNSAYALRLVFDRLSRDPRPFFYASIEGSASGAFDVFFDPLRDEPVLLGQLHKSARGATFYDVWASYKVPGVAAPPVAFRALSYTIDTSILPDSSLKSQAQIRFRTEASGERLLAFQLSRMLNVSEVASDTGQPLDYFQNEGMSFRERSTRGNDLLYVILPEAPPQGSEFSLRFRYRGNVIDDAGNGVYFVGARESWYPRMGDASDFADYDLTLHWPRHLRVVATGTKLEEHDDGDFRVGHWRTEEPASVAGFNLGDYASASVASATHSIDLYANRQLEEALSRRLSPVLEAPRLAPPYGPEGARGTDMVPVLLPPPNPADALRQLGREIEASIHFYETFSGPFPFRQMGVSQIPGSFGQGWPGLLYLPTFSFLPPAVQQRAGLSESVQEQFTELVPVHEVAHQWWGNVVGWGSYRDQWIDEAMANYLAVLFAASRRSADHSLRMWLTRYRRQLLEKRRDSDLPGSEIGALDLGTRLSSSKSPGGFEQVVYSKGTWVIHMLREMLRQPGAKNPDARFIALTRTLANKYAYRALSLTDLQREVEAMMTPGMDLEGGRSMEWFFEEWVRGAGVPHYRVEFTSHPAEKGFVVRGKLFQDGVPRSFIESVPLYVSTGSGRSVPAATVIAAGPVTSFHFVTASAPHKIFIDPQMTLLCVTE